MHECSCLRMYSCSDPACVYRHLHMLHIIMSFKHSPRIALPTVGRTVRREDDNIRSECTIDTDVDAENTDARAGARPTVQGNARTDADQNCTDDDASLKTWVETPASCIPFPVCLIAGHPCRSTFVVPLEPHHSGMMSEHLACRIDIG